MTYKVSEMVDRTIDGWLVHMGWIMTKIWGFEVTDEWTCTSCSWIHFRSWKGQIPTKWVCFWFNYPIKKQWNHEEMHSRWPYFFIFCASPLSIPLQFLVILHLTEHSSGPGSSTNFVSWSTRLARPPPPGMATTNRNVAKIYRFYLKQWYLAVFCLDCMTSTPLAAS